MLNRFQELTQSSAEVSLDSTNIDLIYGNLIEANEEVALSTLPKKHKSQKKPVSLDSKVVDAREKLKQITSAYHCNPSQSNKKKIAEAKKSLDLAYLEVEEAYIKGEIAKISHLHINQQHSAAWKTINQLAGKGSQPPPSVKGGSREQRLANWQSHFKRLLGSPASLPDNMSLPKVRVSQTLNISTGLFTSAESRYLLSSGKNQSFINYFLISAIMQRPAIFHQPSD